MGDPSQVLSSYGPWWATRGRWARDRGDEDAARASFDEAVAADPFDPEGACETLDPAAANDPHASSPTSSNTVAPATVQSKASLCAAARASGEPPYDAD
jgi:hypothetical protein